MKITIIRSFTAALSITVLLNAALISVSGVIAEKETLKLSAHKDDPGSGGPI